MSGLFVPARKASEMKFVTTRARQRCGEIPEQVYKNGIREAADHRVFKWSK